jgi:hypothetical protein
MRNSACVIASAHIEHHVTRILGLLVYHRRFVPNRAQKEGKFLTAMTSTKDRAVYWGVAILLVVLVNLGLDLVDWLKRKIRNSR